MKITLKAARVNKGYTQSQAAELFGITTRTLINYENGKSSPRYETLRKIAIFYDIDIDNIEMPKRKK